MNTHYFSRVWVVLTVVALSLPVVASASLIDRGNGLVYDSLLDITWLQDANLAASETFGVSSGIRSDGSMHWNTANDWIGGMNSYEGHGYLGYSDWRLPNTSPSDCVGKAVGFDKTCSELGSLFYDSLGNTRQLSNTDPFDNIQSASYWSGTRDFPLEAAYDFSFKTGNQDAHYYYAWFYAWAVRPGDASVIPEPGTDVPEPGMLSLFAVAIFLLGMGCRRRRSLTLR